MRHRWLLSLLLVSASGVLQAQSTDSTLVKRTGTNLDSVSSALTKYCNTNSARSYVCVTRKNVAVARLSSDSVLKNKSDTVVKTDTLTVVKIDTVYVVKPDTTKPPVDTTTPPDTVKPPLPPVIFVHPYAPPSNGAAFAEMPRDTVSLAIPPPARRIVTANIQAALDSAKDNDLLVIPAQTTVTCLRVQETPRQTWVTVQGTDSTSVISCGLGGAASSISILPRAHHVQFLGPLVITTTSTATNAVVRSYNGETSLADVPNHIIFNGVTIDPTTKYEVRRCAWPDGAYMAIVNSRLKNCGSKSGDAQAIIVGNGPGPYRFENNYLEGSHQCFMSGGFNPSIVGTVAADIVFRNNYCFKPLWWHYTFVNGAKSYPDSTRQVKTALENKFVTRELIEHNTFRNGWADAQAGFGSLLKSENQGGFPDAQTKDVTLRYNRFVSQDNGMNFAAHPNPGISLARASIYDNLIDSLPTNGNLGICLQLLDDLHDVIFMHNTCTRAGNTAVTFDGAPGVRTVITSNILYPGLYGVKGNSTQQGIPSITKFMPDGLFLYNILPGADCSVYPAGTVCTLAVPVPNSPDGKPIGADLSKLPQ